MPNRIWVRLARAGRRAALRGVIRECWRPGYLECEELAWILEVESVRGSGLLRGGALSPGELVTVFGHLVGQDSAAAPVMPPWTRCSTRRAACAGPRPPACSWPTWTGATGRLVVRAKGNKEREVWLSDEALQAVEDWIQVRGEEPRALLLPVEKDRRSESTVRLACRRRAAQAGLSAFSPHDLPRTSISSLLDLTGDLAPVSELAGRANPATTKRYDRRPAENRRALDFSRDRVLDDPPSSAEFSNTSWGTWGVLAHALSARISPQMIHHSIGHHLPGFEL